ncbi:hypothetical protein DRN87_03825 [Candidatus Geothermarchaeota archaeon]|nr:MAG: hypothetical protein DRN87_03825 [Candidatus Geothermarchaeota archaeon]
MNREEISVWHFMKASLKCPLRFTPSNLLSPITVYQLSKYGSKDELGGFLIWCDGCGLCGEQVFKWIQSLKKSSEYTNQLSNLIKDYELKLVEKGEYLLYIPELIYNQLKPVFTFMLENLNRIGYNVGLLTGPDSGILYNLMMMDEERQISEFTSQLGSYESETICVDKYTMMILGGVDVKCVSLASFIKRLTLDERIYFKEFPSIRLLLLRSAYKFYRSEERTLLNILRIFPNIQIVLSRRRYGLGLSHYYNESMVREYISYIRSKVPYKPCLLSTVDPYLYTYIYKFSIHKTSVLTYLPNLLVSFMESI